MTTLTVENVKATVEDLIEEFGADHVYEFPNRDPYDHTQNGVCVYQVEGKPSCIVGHVVARLNPEFFQEIIKAGEGLNSTGSSGLFQAGLARDEEDTEFFVRRLQRYQDGGDTWGEAYRRALADLSARRASAGSH